MKKGFFQNIGKLWVKHRHTVAMLILLVLAGYGLWQWQAHRQAARPSPAIQAIIEHLQHAPQEVPPPKPPEHAENPPVIMPPPEHPHVLPRLALVVDDVGLTEGETRRAIELPPEVTLSFLPYAPRIQQKVDAAKAAGHEIFLHLPMQAMGGEDAGPGMLRVDMDPDEIRDNLEHSFSSFNGYVGVNNHMGSRFTADEGRMRVFMEEVKTRGLMFLDSRTTKDTKGEMLAREMGVPVARRHVFLDNEITEEAVAAQFTALLKLADHQRVAVAILHPHTISLEVLENVLPYLKGRYELVPVSAVVSRP